MSHLAPDLVTNGATHTIASFAAGKPELAALADMNVAAELTAALRAAGVLHPGGFVEHHRVHGVLVEDGRAVQRVAPGDEGYERAQYFVRQSVQSPWVAEAEAGPTNFVAW